MIAEGCTYGDKIRNPTTRFEDAFSKLLETLRSTSHQELLGFELNDLLSGGVTVKSKRLIIQWGIKKLCALAEKGDIVFCRYIGDIIGPANVEGEQSR